MHRKKILRISILIAAALLLILFTTILLLNEHTNKQINREIQEIRNKSEPVSYIRFFRPISDEENAYLVYTKGFDNIDAKMEKWKDLSAMRDVIGGHAPLAPENIQQIRDLLEKNKLALELFHQASAISKCQSTNYNVRGKPLGENPYADVTKGVSLLLGEALIKAKEHQYRQALISINSAIQLLRVLETGPSLSSRLDKLVSISRILSSLKAISYEEEIDEVFLKDLLKEIPCLENVVGLQKDLIGERCLIIEEGFSPEQLRESKMIKSWAYYFLLSPIGKIYLKMDELFYLRTMKRIIEISSLLPYQTGSDRKLISQQIADSSNYNLSHEYLLLWEKYFKDAYYYQTKVELSQTAMLLRLYKLKNGVYPDGIKDLKGDLLETPPKDPFSGDSFIYHKKGDDFILYSIGPNRQDDGGINDSSNNKDDIAW